MDRPFSGEKNFVTTNKRPAIKQTDKTEHSANTAHQSHHGSSSISFVKSWKIVCLAHRIQQPILKLLANPYFHKYSKSFEIVTREALNNMCNDFAYKLSLFVYLLIGWFIYFSQKFFCTIGHRNFCTEALLQKFLYPIVQKISVKSRWINLLLLFFHPK